VLFTNGPELLDNTYLRFLLKHFREQLPFKEVPIKLVVRHRHGDRGRGEEPPEALEELAALEEQATAEATPEPAARKRPRPSRKKKKPGSASQLWKDV
jgi:GTP-binding protein